MLKSPSARLLARLLARQAVTYALAGGTMPRGGHWLTSGVTVSRGAEIPHGTGGRAALCLGAAQSGYSRAILCD